MRWGLVLGAGGLVGMAYHAAVLKACEEHGLRPGAADVVVGTSAGAVLGAYLAAGWTPEDFFEYAHGRHANAPADAAAQRAEVARLFVPMWRSGLEAAGRAVGSAFALAAAKGLWRAGASRAPRPGLRRRFPSGLFSTDQTGARLRAELPEAWPREHLYVCATDLYSGRRVAFGAPDAPPATLPDAVLASTAIPGVYPPVRIAGRQYVDGGAVSATSLDVAVAAGCDAILCVAPLGYLAGRAALPDPRLWGAVLSRAVFVPALRREVRAARARGVAVLVIRPTLDELRLHGVNAMRHFDRGAFVDATRAAVRAQLAQHAAHPVIARRVRAAPPA